jgi:hypothetical protein
MKTEPRVTALTGEITVDVVNRGKGKVGKGKDGKDECEKDAWVRDGISATRRSCSNVKN